VRTRPADLSDAQVAAALREGWTLDVSALEYKAVGFGSYHWWAQSTGADWFVTADDLELRRRKRSEPLGAPRQRLVAALSTARALHDAGLDFVVAPTPTRLGGMVHEVGTRFAVALYPHVVGEVHTWGPYPTRRERLAVLERVVAVHAAPASACRTAMLDHLLIQHRDQLSVALAGDDVAWGPGPFGEPARRLLGRHRSEVLRALDRYDALATVARRHDRMVLTHGEPHRGNTITTAKGVALIDWDTTLLAPPERDLWMLTDEDPSIVDDYAERSGRALDQRMLELYRLSWDLTEVAIYVSQFRQAHPDDADTRHAWSGLARYLAPTGG
jgi:hypothetical protein